MKKVKWVVHAEDIIEVGDDMSEDEIWEECMERFTEYEAYTYGGLENDMSFEILDDDEEE